MKSIAFIKKILAKRKESGFANSGFIAGLVAGIITGIFSLFVLIINKELYFKELATLEKFSISLPIQSIWILSLIAIPPIVVAFYCITGLLSGLLFEKLNIKSFLIVLLFYIVVGFLWGIVTNLPVARMIIVIFNIAAWLAGGIVFNFVWKKVK